MPLKLNFSKSYALVDVPRPVVNAVKTFEMSLDRPPKDVQELIDFFKNRKLSKLSKASTKADYMRSDVRIYNVMSDR